MIRLPTGRVGWLQAIIVFAIVFLLIGGGGYISARYEHLQAHVASLESRYARLIGMSQRQADFDEVGKQAGDLLKSLAYPAGQDATQAGNDAQQRIRTLFAESKLEISSIQVLPPKEEGQFDRIPIDLRVEGDLTSVQNALSLLTLQSPMVLTEDVSLQTIGAVKPASVQRLSGQFLFYVFRVRS